MPTLSNEEWGMVCEAIKSHLEELDDHLHMLEDLREDETMHDYEKHHQETTDMIKDAEALLDKLHSEPLSLFLNHYRCPNDNEEWNDTWSCSCNDRCPKCDAEIEPFESEDITEQEFALLDWQEEVRMGDTRLGFDDWVQHQIESEYM